MPEHSLKILPEYFRDVVAGRKRFEIRRDDRGIMEGDSLTLREFDGLNYTGRRVGVVVSYRTTFEQKPGFVVFGIEPAQA